MQISTKIGYSAGDFGLSISYFVVGFFYMYYLTDVAGIAPWLAGSVIFIGKLWEGIGNPLAGILSDKTKSAFGQKRAFILFGAIPFAVSFVLLWIIPASYDNGIKFVLAIISLLLYTSAYSVVAVPYMALVPVMTNDYDERTQITGIRAVMSTLGIVLGGGAALLVSSFTDLVLGLRTMAIGFAVFTAMSLLIAARSVKGVEKANNKSSIIVRASLGRYISLMKEKNVAILLAFKFLGAVATGCLIASIPYFAKNVLANTGSSSIGVGIYTICSALLIPVWYKLTRVFDKRRLLLIANSLGAVVLVLTSLLVNRGYTIQFFVGCALLGIIMSSYLLIPYSLVPDLVEFYRHKRGEQHESLYFGLWMTVHQLGIAVSGFMLGGLLSLAGYNGSSEVQTPSAILAIRLAFGFIPGLFLVLAAAVLQKYGITRTIYQKVLSELERHNAHDREAYSP